jgi:hypothetical protein
MRGSMSPSVIRLATISSTNRYRSMYLMIAGAPNAPLVRDAAVCQERPLLIKVPL